MLPASDIEMPATDRRAAFRPTVVDGARPALDLEQMTALMEALEAYVEASFIPFDGVDPAPIVSD